MALLMKMTTAASTLPEILVASVIWLLFFFITITLLTEIAISRTGNGALLEAEMELRTCLAEVGIVPEGETLVQNYDWGEIRIDKERCGDAIYRVRMTAIIKNGDNRIGYTRLIHEE